jgi:hypothetical protein
MHRRLGLRAAVTAAAVAACCCGVWPADLSIVERSPSALTMRLSEWSAGRLYRVVYDDGAHRFIWENLSPDDVGSVRLTDDGHLRPEYRLRCESRVSHSDPVVFDDLVKGPIAGNRRMMFGVPVSSFGGPGYLVPGVSDLRRDGYGNFWLYLDRPPYAILKYDPGFKYEFALLTPGRVLAHDVDAGGNLYLLHPGNWISKHGPRGESEGAWELPQGREPGEFVSASGLVIDRQGGFIYLADERLGRVQRFTLDLELRPFPFSAWGWIGREDLVYTAEGQYDRDRMYYQLDRPRQLRLDGRGHLLVSCEHYVSQFDLADGRQIPFGPHPVLGWGGSFTDSAFSDSAALDGHWQRQWLAGVDGSGRIYVADRENEFLVNPRLQVYGPDGNLLQCYETEDEVRDEAGRPVHLTAVAGLAAEGDTVWVVDAAGRVYESRGGLRGGGHLFLGPGAAGRQFDLSRAEEDDFTVEAQAARVQHRTEGIVLGFPAGQRGTGNCEREGSAVLEDGERSMWLLTRLGDPFRVRLLDDRGEEIPARHYSIELEGKRGLFGTRYDYFRVTNQSGAAWHDVRFIAETPE